MAKFTYAEEERKFHKGFWKKLVDAGILEAGHTHPDAVKCPHCGHTIRPESMLEAQTVVCAGVEEAPGGRIVSQGCGKSVDIPAMRPMHQVWWCYDPPRDKPKVQAHWRKGVAEDHPAREVYQKLLGEFLAEIN